MRIAIIGGRIAIIGGRNAVVGVRNAIIDAGGAGGYFGGRLAAAVGATFFVAMKPDIAGPPAGPRT